MEWTLVTSKNHVVKSKKRDKCETVTSDQLITTMSRFTLLSNLEVNNVDYRNSEWI